MMIVVAIAFIISWTPFYIITFISQVQKRSFLKDSNFLFTMLFIHWFGFLHSCINPFIYNFMNEKFHRNFKQIFHRCWPQRHTFRKNSTLLFGGSSSKSSKSNSNERHRHKTGNRMLEGPQQCMKDIPADRMFPAAAPPVGADERDSSKDKKSRSQRKYCSSSSGIIPGQPKCYTNT